MGLFGNKKTCAICGGKVPLLFPWKVDGQYVCNLCHGLVDLPRGMEDGMTMEEFKAYRQFREENQQLKQQFQVTQKVDVGWLDDKFMFDATNGLLCMDKNLDKTIFYASQVRSFVIKEDNVPLFEGSSAGLICYTSTIPDRVMAMAPQINQFRMQAQMQRNMERLADRLDDGKSNSTYTSTHIDIPEPFKGFLVEIRFEHPYWSVFTADMTGPTFDNDIPDVDDYLRDYHNKAETMGQLARALMQVAFPSAPEQQVASTTAPMAGQTIVTPTASVDAVAEIQRFKNLMDQGIITEEEFVAKKRQLLGI